MRFYNVFVKIPIESKNNDYNFKNKNETYINV